MDNTILTALLTQVFIEFVIPAGGTILTALIGFLLVELWKLARVRLGKERFQQVVATVHRYVKAAEQIGLRDDILESGEAKREWVIAQTRQWAKRNGLNVDVETIFGVLEEAILEGVQHGYRDLIGTATADYIVDLNAQTVDVVHPPNTCPDCGKALAT